jgi:acetoacetyl-CoA synthetase
VDSAWSVTFAEPLDPDCDLLEAVLEEPGVFRAVRLHGMIEHLNAITGLMLPITVVFAARTPRALSRIVRDRQLPPIKRPVLMRAGTGRPLFVLPGVGGMGLDMLETIARLRFDGPIYLNVSCGVDYREAPLTTMSAMVADHLKMIRDVQANGPYLLLGYSFGAQIAIEVARTLTGDGEAVDFLAGIDPQLNEAHWPFTVWLGYSGRRLRHHLRRMQRMRLGEVGAYAVGRLLPLAGRFGRKLGMERPFGWSPYDQQGLSGVIDAVWKAEVKVGNAFRMPFFPGRVILFFSRGGEAALANPKRLWDRQVRQPDLHWLEGNHLQIMREPLVRNLADAISRTLPGAGG